MKKISLALLLLGSISLSLLFFGCGTVTNPPEPEPVPTDAPTFTLAAGTYEAASILVTIEALSAEAIYYTVDGSDPVALAASGSTLYSGPFTLESSAVVKAIAVQTGYTTSDVSSVAYDIWWWQALGSGFGSTDEVYALAYDPDNGILYAAGIMNSAGGVSVTNIAKWDGSAWSAVGSGIGDAMTEVNTLFFHSGNLYAGGSFTSPGNNIAKWNGTAWSTLGSGIGDVVFTIDIDQSGNLVVGGDYNTPANYLAKWNGTAWSAFSTEPNNRVSSLAYDAAEGILYAGGWFNNIGTNLIAKWNGTAWSSLGNGITNTSVPADLNAIAAGGGNLYAAGAFDTAGTATVSNIAKWNGTTWSALGSGVNDKVYTLAYDPSQGLLYVGGRFTSPTSNLARWNGSAWSLVGGTNNGTGIQTLIVAPGGALYAVGDFTQIGGISANRIARWGRK